MKNAKNKMKILSDEKMVIIKRSPIGLQEVFLAGSLHIIFMKNYHKWVCKRHFVLGQGLQGNFWI